MILKKIAFILFFAITMDVLLLGYYIFDGYTNECQDSIMNINSDGFINVLDVISLVQSIMSGNN